MSNIILQNWNFIKKESQVNGKDAMLIYVKNDNGELYSVVQVVNNCFYTFEGVIKNKDKKSEYLDVYNGFLGSIK